jgi:glycopeptide antibiotics resistance protein
MIEIVWIASAVLVGALLLPVLSRLFSGNDRLFRNVRVLVLILYILIILYVTLLSRPVTRHFKYQFSLFWSYREALALRDDSRGLGLFITDSVLFKQILLNILLYVPLGYLLSFALPRLVKTNRRASRFRVINMLRAFPWIAVLIGAALSIAIEFTQLLFRLGLFEFDDIFNNVLGCLCGVILYQVLVRPLAKKKE